MNLDYEQKLEAEIDRRLKSLPEISAPATLANRVMAAIAAAPQKAWYRQPWQNWPLGLRMASLACVVALVAGAYIAVRTMPRPAFLGGAMREISSEAARVSSIWNVLQTLRNSIVLAAQHLGTGFLIGCAAALFLGYAVTIGVGGAVLRFAWSQRSIFDYEIK